MLKIFLRVLCVCMGASVLSLPAAAQNAFTFGVMPYHSARVIIEQHRPVLLFLRDDLKLTARLETSTSFKSFYEGTVRGDYDLVAIAAHFARLLEKEHGFIPLVRYGTGGRCTLMVREDSRIRKVPQLAGKLLATPDRLALGTIVCLDVLNRQGLQEGRDFKVKDVATFNSAVLAVERNDADAAVSAPAALMQMRPEQRSQLRRLSDSDPFTNLVYMAHPRVAPALREQLRTGLLRFSEQPAGHDFFKSTGFGAFIPADEKTMRDADRYLPETRRLLQQSTK